MTRAKPGEGAEREKLGWSGAVSLFSAKAADGAGGGGPSGRPAALTWRRRFAQNAVPLGIPVLVPQLSPKPPLTPSSLVSVGGVAIGSHPARPVHWNCDSKSEVGSGWPVVCAHACVYLCVRARAKHGDEMQKKCDRRRVAEERRSDTATSP